MEEVSGMVSLSQLTQLSHVRERRHPQRTRCPGPEPGWPDLLPQPSRLCLLRSKQVCDGSLDPTGALMTEMTHARAVPKVSGHVT